MPIYVYEHPKTGERKEVVQRMTEEHSYTDSEGVKWLRIFGNVGAQIDSFDKLNPHDKQAFIKKTASRGMTMGEMWDESARLSERRSKATGIDPVKQEAIKKYHKLTGKPHPHENPN
jgi:hypothetical protein